MTDSAHDHLPETALAWHCAGKGAALATVIATWSSAPRPVGSQLAISGAGEIMGSISGGCVEAAVVEEALAAMAEARPRILSYGIEDGTAFAAGLACGGTIRVLVEPLGTADGALSPELLADLVSARAAERAVALTTDLESWSRVLLRPGENATVDLRFRSDRSGLDENGRFIAIHNPPLRLIILGAVPIAVPLLAMARACGYACCLIDPRSTFAAAARFPGERILDGWPDDALTGLSPDARTAIVTLTHVAALDDAAIRVALASEAFYVGCLGSARTHAGRLERLAAAGLSPADLTRLHGPVGLDIGARSAAEIAVSILAEMTGVLRSSRGSGHG